MKADGCGSVMMALVGRILDRLRDADNVYYEICNEPYGLVPADWERHMADVIVAAEAGFPYKHLVSQNVDGNKVENPTRPFRSSTSTTPPRRRPPEITG